jgi:N-acyl-D-amino-acid deacylase
MIEIAEKSGVHVQISHLKLMGAPQWGNAPKLIAKLDEAREEMARQIAQKEAKLQQELV